MHHFTAISEFKLELHSGNNKFGSKSAISFVPRDLQMWQMTLKNNEAPVLYNIKLCAYFQSNRRIQTGVTVRRFSVRIKICDFSLEIWRMTLKNNKAPLLCHCKFCELFHRHIWIQTGLTVRKRPVLVKLGDFLSSMTLKFDEWPGKNKHPFYATSSIVHHFIAIYEFKIVTVRKRPLWVKIDVCFSRVTLTFDKWPWKTIGRLS